MLRENYRPPAKLKEPRSHLTLEKNGLRQRLLLRLVNEQTVESTVYRYD